MNYGPNMGDFSTLLDIKNAVAHYDVAKEDAYTNCVYDFAIKNAILTACLISGGSCGFVHNVSAEGVYQKVDEYKLR